MRGILGWRYQSGNPDPAQGEENYIRPKLSDLSCYRLAFPARMLRLTKSADYGLIAMRHLALQAGSASARDLARAHGIPPQLLAKVLQRLVKAGLLVSQHGIRGGYVLARDPRRISALEVIQAIEGPPSLTSCTTVRGPCGQTRDCTVREPLRRLSRSLQAALGRISLRDLSEPDSSQDERPAQDLVAIKTMD